MPKFPRISGNQMTRYLQGRGFAVTRRKGIHATLRRGSEVTVVPAGNKKLRIKPLFSILRYANISKEEFADGCGGGPAAQSPQKTPARKPKQGLPKRRPAGPARTGRTLHAPRNACAASGQPVPPNTDVSTKHGSA